MASASAHAHAPTSAPGRRCAQRICPQFTGVPLRLVHWVVLSLLLVVPGYAIGRLFSRDHALVLAGWVMVASLISYALNAWDKRRAQRGDWRVSERALHFWELLGGWPGAFLAQRRLRHKSAKMSYLANYWLIVALHHYLAIDALLGWRWFRQFTAWVRTFA